MGIAERLDYYSSEYWDFRDVKTDGIHCIANYPAPMVAPMQYEILKVILEYNPNYRTLLDPFHGSGVTLVEGQSFGLEVYGIDINPYAHIITNAKLEKYNPDVIQKANRRLIRQILKLRDSGIYNRYYFNNIEKWFREDIVTDLSIIRDAIIKEKNRKTRRYYWLCFGEIVKKYSNTRTSTFKLHLKPQENIVSMSNNVINDFITKIERTYLQIGYPCLGKYQLTCGDSILELANMKKNSIDIICTSPPYGDNKTTVTYGQFSALQLMWIDNNDFNYDLKYLENYSKIDSLSMGGCFSNNDPEYIPTIFEKYLNMISTHKRTKVSRFFADYENAFRNMVRILSRNGCIILTLGNRRIDDLEFPFIQLNEDLADYYGLKQVYKFTRNIVNKRMPYKVSRLSNGKSVKSMSEETVLFLKKGGL